MRLRFRNQFKIILVLLSCVVFYNEYVIYTLQTYRWPNLTCAQDSSCLRILLVADPQILGEQNDDSPFKYIFNWDSDRYVAKTYVKAVSHFEPDVILFLGDIMNEGTVASDEEFQSYVQRLSSIFVTSYPMKHVWIPGDNDIGGENKPIYPKKLRMFNDAFNQPDFMSIKFLNIYKINSITQTYPKLPSHHIIMTNKTNIVMSHIPLLLSPGRFTGSVLTKIQPVVMFSGHKHAAFHLQTTLDTMFVSKVMAMNPQSKNNVIDIVFRQDTYHEFIVPTCSYRMGVPNMGFGIAVIDKSKLSYSILWSPRRYEQLIVYVVVVISVILYLITVAMFKMASVVCRNIQYSKV
ncbi:metallophosphoesterase isoform X2 [Arctopsyche grandis]|uniref:metallophosphoesterase isoform X2 n=1 Tax=Arctopsyche grandis TaxID=121162 RepID=UPI00406D7FAA